MNNNINKDREVELKAIAIAHEIKDDGFIGNKYNAFLKSAMKEFKIDRIEAMDIEKTVSCILNV